MMFLRTGCTSLAVTLQIVKKICPSFYSLYAVYKCLYRDAKKPPNLMSFKYYVLVFQACHCPFQLTVSYSMGTSLNLIFLNYQFAY
jgi:hypothetical protein